MEVKLFDFRLMTCVKRTSNPTDTFEMTGRTGSLRYMAPEVALKKAYNEKVDIHSFGIILWEMVKGKLPFKGVSKAEYMSQVVGLGYRPAVTKDMPVALTSLMKKCWDPDYQKRPSCSQIMAALELMSTADERSVPLPDIRATNPTVFSSIREGTSSLNAKSTWF
jgi:serine/threonine protein kinase